MWSILKKKKRYIEFSSNEILISTRSTELLSIESIHRNVKFLLFERKIVTNEKNNWISFILCPSTGSMKSSFIINAHTFQFL